MSRLRRIRRRWLVIPAFLTILLIYAAWPGRWTYTISPETTYVTEPVDADGYVDYPTALNERMGKGITPDNNANVLIWKALGPHPEGATMPVEYFRWLGIDQPPEEGDYLIDSNKYFKANLETPNDIVGLFDKSSDWKLEWVDCLDHARKWPWKASEQPAIADWLKKNEKPLAIAIEASKRPKYFYPLVSKSQDARQARLIGALLPNVQKCREMVNQLKSRAMMRVAERDFDQAWQDLMACQRLGRLIAGNGCLIETLVGVAMVAVASDGQITLLSQGNHSATQSRGWLEDLQKLPPFPPLADKFELGERFMTLDALQSIACGGPQQLQSLNSPNNTGTPSDPFWEKLFSRNIDWDPAFRNCNRMYDRLVTATRLPDRAARASEYAKINSEIQSVVALTRQANVVGKVFMSRGERGEMIGNLLLDLMLPAIEKIQDSADRIEQTEINLQIAFALAIYRAEVGHYPTRLDELAPKYVAKVSPDLFSGKPLVYKPSRDGYLLYSVGINGIDEEGRWTDDNPRGDDLRVRMPVPEPKAK